MSEDRSSADPRSIAIFGLGYVGVVSAACLARLGHGVTGVDLNAAKVEMIRAGKSPIVEPELDQLLEEGVAAGTIVAHADARAAIADSDMAWICVGTPSLANGNIDLASVTRVCEEIAAVLAEQPRPFTVVVRSTVLPGTMAETVQPVFRRHLGAAVGRDVRLCFHPEFLREGAAVHDFFNPPKIVIGVDEAGVADDLVALYDGFDAPLHVIDTAVAEMAKYVDNAWHALKVGFANEVGRLARAVSIDGREVMKVFCSDTKLNISTAYLRPGFAFGGSCLPKDLRALTYAGKRLDLELPMLNNVLASNDRHLETAVEMVRALGNRQVTLLGLSFKPNTDDLRESPMVALAERLIGKGYELRVYDPWVALSRLVGANREYLFGRLPHIERLLVDDLAVALEHGKTVVVGHCSKEEGEQVARLRGDKQIVDLAGAIEGRSDEHGYQGICW